MGSRRWPWVPARRLTVALAVISSGASAYVRTTSPTTGLPVRLEASEVALVVVTETLPPELDAAGAVAAASEAAAAWNRSASCSTVRIRIAGVGSSAPLGDDGTNRIAFHRAAWCQDGLRQRGKCYRREQAAITTMHYDAAGTRIVGADIELNAVDMFWQSADNGREGRTDSRVAVDLVAVLTHEFGHVLGFEHPCRGGAGSTASADDQGRLLGPCTSAHTTVPTVMYPGPMTQVAGSKSGVEAEDIRGLCAVYPKPVTPRAPGCGCATDLQQPDEWIGLWAIVPMLFGVRRRLRQDSRGRSSPRDGANRRFAPPTR